MRGPEDTCCVWLCGVRRTWLCVCNVSNQQVIRCLRIGLFYFSGDLVWSLLWDHNPKMISHCWMDDIVFCLNRNIRDGVCSQCQFCYKQRKQLIVQGIYWAVHKAFLVYKYMPCNISSYITYWHLQNPFTGYTFLAGETNLRKMTDNHTTMTMPFQSGADNHSSRAGMYRLFSVRNWIWLYVGILEVVTILPDTESRMILWYYRL